MPAIILSMSADLYQGPPIADLTLDGVALPSVPVTVVNGSGVQAITIEAAPGHHLLSVGFANDAWGGTPDTDRNLYLKSVDGVVETVPEHMFASNGVITLTLTVPGVVAAPVVAAPVVVAPVVAPVVPAPVVAAPVVAAPVQAPVVAPAPDNGPKLDLIYGVLKDILAQLKIVPLVAAAPAAPAAPAGPPALIPCTAPAGWTTLTLTPADNLRSATESAGKGFKLLLTPGHYKQVLHIPAGLDGWEIASTTGSAADVQLDGQGGLTVAQNNSGAGPTRLAYGKGVIHSSSAGTIRDIEIMGGGLNATDGHDGQAGVYWDVGDAKGATATLLRCMVRKNQNGVFGNTQNANFHLVFDSCDFEGNSADGGSHDCYINGSGDSSLTVINCRALGSNAGNNFKTRIPKVTMTGGFYASQNANRWVELADGGVLDIHGGVYIGNDSGQNVFGNGTESTSKGPGNTTWDGSVIYLGNRAADFCNAGTFLATGVTVHANLGGGGNIFNSKGTPLVGLVIGAAAAAPTPPPYVSGAK